MLNLPVKDGKGVLDTDCNFVIWTTTPWTIPANLGISVNPDFDYSLVDTEKGKLIMLSKLWLKNYVISLKLKNVMF